MSIYQLINKLCFELIKDCDYDEINVQTARKTAFEVLLKKSFQDENFLAPEKTIEDFQFTRFELSLHKRSKEVEEIDDFIEILKENSDVLLPISRLLFLLKNIDSNEKNEPYSFLQLQTKALNDSKKNKYLAHISLSKDSPSQLHKKTSDGSLTFLSSILASYVGHNDGKNLKLKITENPNHISSTPSNVEDENSSKNNYKKVNNWENLDACDDYSLKSFCTESSIPFIYQRLKLSGTRQPSAKSTEITVVSFPKLLNDIKLLMIGIESETFKKSETLKFFMTTKLSCENIYDLDGMIDKFIEMGTCFARLKSYTAKNPFNQNQIFEGFIFKTFCDRVIKFLNYSRDLIYSQHAETFLELYRSTSKIIKIIVHLSNFLNIHPSSTSIQRNIPNGSDFLRLLYNEYTHVLDNNVKCFYIDLLKSCCSVYYVRYQEWLYHGKLDDPYKELFIYFVDRYTENTKNYFDKAYLVRRQSVPEFLANCADDILLCGRYTILLKSFNPVHPILTIKKPSFKICLTHDQINDLKQHCREFSKKARIECGESISISEILENKRRKKLEKYKNAEIASTKNALKWKQYQEDRLQEIKEFREAQQKELRKELELIEEKKMLRKMLEIQAERDYLDEMDKIEDEELHKENEMLKARVKIYQELNEKLADEIDTVKLKSVEDEINANTPVTVAKESTIVKDDNMNNILDTKEPLTDAQRNKIKVLSHEYNFMSDDGINNNENNTNDGAERSLTDAQKNKLKIMGHEFGMIEDNDEATRPKINVQDIDKMTDLQRNRLKVLSHEFALDDDRRKRDELDVLVINKNPQMTELQRNRKKVMSHEFGWEQDKVESKKLSLELLKPVDGKQTVESPMSTTSDHFNNSESIEKSSVDLAESSISSSNGKQQRQTQNDEIDDENEEIFKAFEEAMEKNRMKFVGLKLNDSAENSLQYLQNSNEITKLDTIGMSEFLQMSLTLPLNAYMEILNNETLKMYVKDLNILSHFKSLRNYFLLMNGEFCSCICHEIFSKIESGMRPVELLNYQSLHMILDNALSNSRFYDPNTENLSFIVQNVPEKFELHSPSILSMLTLTYQLEWPLSLILSPETMNKYRAIFNYLIKLKRITWILEQCFQLLKESHKKHGTDLLKSEQYRNVQHIRHKMTQFVNCLENYVTRNVIQISWNGFIEDIKSAESILCIYRKHANYLKRILFLCLLNKSYTEFYKNIEDIFKVILKFYKHLKSGNWQFSSSTYTHEKYKKIEVDADEFHRLIRYILYLGNKVIQQGYQKEIYDLLHLIDVNGYYSCD